MIEEGITPMSRGGRTKEYLQTDEYKDNVIKRLKMENKLLRDFLYLVGRM